MGFAARRPTRTLLSVGVGAGVLAVLLLLASPARAPAADTDLTKDALDARKAVNLPAIEANPAVQAAAGAVLDGGDPQGAFTSRGGTGRLVTAKVPAGGALSTAELKVVVFDPRLTAIAVLGRDRSVAVAAVLDPGRPFQAPVVAGALFDPATAGSLAVLFPPATAAIPSITLSRYRGGQLITIELAGTAGPGLEGAVLVGLRGRDRLTGPQIGYETAYTLRVGTDRFYSVRTRPVPNVLVSRSFVAGPGFTGADRQRFLKAVATLPPAARKIVDVIGGAVTVSVLADTSPICIVQTSCAGFDPGHGYFLIVNRAQLRRASGKFVIAHELGHLVDFLGLDTFSHQDFRALFSKSPKWKECFPVQGTCAPGLEVFADQFGYFSTNAPGVQSGYGDTRLVPGSPFSNVLRAQWTYRPPQEYNPLAGFGPLARSFEIALRSGQGWL